MGNWERTKSHYPRYFTYIAFYNLQWYIWPIPNLAKILKTLFVLMYCYWSVICLACSWLAFCQFFLVFKTVKNCAKLNRSIPFHYQYLIISIISKEVNGYLLAQKSIFL